jgi:hypothetical protein
VSPVTPANLYVLGPLNLRICPSPKRERDRYRYSAHRPKLNRKVRKLRSRSGQPDGYTDPLALVRRIGPQLGYAGGAVLMSLRLRLAPVASEFIALRVRSTELKEVEIVVLRHEVAILRRKTRHPAITAVDRVVSINPLVVSTPEIASGTDVNHSDRAASYAGSARASMTNQAVDGDGWPWWFGRSARGRVTACPRPGGCVRDDNGPRTHAPPVGATLPQRG